jgi:hypothetical protein
MLHCGGEPAQACAGLNPAPKAHTNGTEPKRANQL